LSKTPLKKRGFGVSGTIFGRFSVIFPHLDLKELMAYPVRAAISLFIPIIFIALFKL
jgi:hypothetical protein